MFTGIVRAVGEVVGVEETAGGTRLRVAAGDVLAGLERGASVAVSGACLTVEDRGRLDDGRRWVEVFLAAETRDRTYLGDLAAGDPVNLEPGLPADGRLDGHVVQGHVDATTPVRAVRPVGEDREFVFDLPEGLARYVVEKGFVALDGVSLTVAGVDDAGTFSVAVIPETYDRTALSAKSPGDPVNVEVDVLAKYVERLLEAGGDRRGG